MFWLCLIFSALVSKAEYDRVATAQTTQLPGLSEPKGLSTQGEDGQMTNLLDVLTVYRSVISFNPSDKVLRSCCESVTVTPHLDLMVIFTRHVNSWVKYASGDKAPAKGRGDGPSPPPHFPPRPPPPILKEQQPQTSVAHFNQPKSSGSNLFVACLNE
ncbi:hypothetical protein ACOMHN_004236 [Nucella lapillus]